MSHHEPMTSANQKPRCQDCRGYGDHAYGDGLSWWNVKCETCKGSGVKPGMPIVVGSGAVVRRERDKSK